MDGGGTPHAAAVLDDGVFHLTNASGRWTRQRLSRALEGGSDGQPAIALDTDGSLTVAFTRYSGWRCAQIACSPSPSEGIFLTTNRAGGWSEPVAVAPRHSRETALRVADGRTHLVYVLGDTGHYATDSGGGWASYELVGSGSWAHSLDVGTDGLARIAFAADDGVRFARHDGKALVTQPVVSDPERPMLLLDQADSPTIVYASGGWPRDLKATHLRNGEWSVPEDLGNTDFWAGVADAQGKLHLITRDVDGAADDHAGLWYATNRSGELTFRRVGEQRLMADAGLPRPVIAVDQHGRPHVLWVVRDEGRRRDGLWYAAGPSR